MDNDVQIIFAGCKARLFNERFRHGDAVMHRLTPGGIAQFDRGIVFDAKKKGG